MSEHIHIGRLEELLARLEQQRGSLEQAQDRTALEDRFAMACIPLLELGNMPRNQETWDWIAAAVWRLTDAIMAQRDRRKKL